MKDKKYVVRNDRYVCEFNLNTRKRLIWSGLSSMELEENWNAHLNVNWLLLLWLISLLKSFNAVFSRVFGLLNHLGICSINFFTAYVNLLGRVSWNAPVSHFQSFHAFFDVRCYVNGDVKKFLNAIGDQLFYCIFKIQNINDAIR